MKNRLEEKQGERGAVGNGAPSKLLLLLLLLRADRQAARRCGLRLRPRQPGRAWR